MILSFQETFVPAVVAGTKLHTIRAGSRWRKDMPIQFYKNARQKSMAKIRADGVVTSVQNITIKRAIRVAPSANPVIWIDDHMITPAVIEQMAQRDGFATADELFQFIDQLHGLPFEGQLIHWTDLRY